MWQCVTEQVVGEYPTHHRNPKGMTLLFKKTKAWQLHRDWAEHQVTRLVLSLSSGSMWVTVQVPCTHACTSTSTKGTAHLRIVDYNSSVSWSIAWNTKVHSFAVKASNVTFFLSLHQRKMTYFVPVSSFTKFIKNSSKWLKSSADSWTQ